MAEYTVPNDSESLALIACIQGCSPESVKDAIIVSTRVCDHNVEPHMHLSMFGDSQEVKTALVKLVHAIDTILHYST